MPHQVIGTCHNWQSDSQQGTSQNRSNFAGKDQYRQHVPNGDHQPQAQPNLYPQHVGNQRPQWAMDQLGYYQQHQQQVSYVNCRYTSQRSVFFSCAVPFCSRSAVY